LKLDWRRSGILSRLSGPNLFDLRFFWWTYFVAFVVQITFDVIAYDSPSWLWLPVWTGGHLLATAAAIVIRWGFLDAYLSRKPNPYLNMLVAGVLGVVRVSFIGYASFVLELQGMFDLGARVIAGAISGVVGFTVIVNYTESSKSFNGLSKKLLKTQAQLQNLRKSALESVRESQLEAQQKVEQLIEPRLRELNSLVEGKKLDSKAKAQVADEIKSLLQGEVRSLSESFRKPTKTLLNPDSFRSVSRLSLFRLPDLVSPHLAIRPAMVSLAALAGVPFSLYVFESTQWVPLGFLIVAINFLMLVFGKFLLSKIKPVPIPIAITYLVILGAITVGINFPLLHLFGYPSNGIIYVVIIGAITILASMIGFGLVVVYDNNMDAYAKALMKNNDRIERELALVNQQIWVERRQWALRIHGTVQASLTAALVRLSKVGKIDKADLKLVREHIASARKGLVASNTAFDLKKALSRIKKTWKGIIEIKIKLSSDSAKMLLADQWAGVCANEIIKESVSNSMKHGKASKVKIRFETAEPGFIRIVAEDNGRGLPNQFRPGLGSQLLDEIAFPWSLTKIPGGVRLVARIPVAKRRLAR
jgi:signal transduction histidine kinase